MPFQYSNSEWNNKKVILGETPLTPSDPAILLIGFHGADSTPENMLIYGNQLTLENTLMVFPEGPVDAGDGLWSWWKDGPKQAETVQQFITYSQTIIEQAQAFAQTKYDSFHTCLWGFSQGAAASLVYALIGHHPIHKVASICGFLPELPEGGNRNSPSNILGIYGAQDDIVPSFMADFALEEMSNRGHQLTARETPQGHEVHADNIRDLIEFFSKP